MIEIEMNPWLTMLTKTEILKVGIKAQITILVTRDQIITLISKISI